MSEWLTEEDFEQIKAKGVGYKSGQRLMAEHGALRATLQAKDAELEALALAVLNSWAFPEDEKWATQAHTLARAATGDGEVTPYRDALQAKDALLEQAYDIHEAKDNEIERCRAQIERLDRELNPFRYIDDEEEATDDS